MSGQIVLFSPPSTSRTGLNNSSSIRELGWENPINAYGTSATEELAFILRPFANLRVYADSRIEWHCSQCPLEKVTDFFLQIEQHSFFLLFIKLVASLALSMPESLTGQLREAALGQLAVCAPQLKAAFHAGVMKLKMPTHYADYADSVHNYMAQVLDISVPILGGSIPRPPLDLQLTKGFFLHMCLRDLDQSHQRHPLLHHRLLQSATAWRHWIESNFPPALLLACQYHHAVFSVRVFLQSLSFSSSLSSTWLFHSTMPMQATSS